ncbi:glycosyltransferase family 4 protein [Micrococcus terreus]|uniref:glycosyltransferase family 4 protein n=1 Tax=Micrococcus terreus TaxID=574650 RepID=UPI0033E27CE2
MDAGIDLDPVMPARSAAHRKVRDVIEHRSGVAWDLAVRGIRQARPADAVLAILEDKAVAPSILKRRHRTPYAQLPLVTVSCWWAEELKNGTTARRRDILRTLSGVDAVIVFSANQREIFADAGYPADRVHPVRFGVDPSWYCPAPPVETSVHPRPVQVLASGVDRGRDFDTLAEAARLLPHLTFTVVTQAGRVRNPPPNMILKTPVSMEEHRTLLRSAELVVVPTHDLAYPTGQSVLLEAMACGRPAAVTGTDAMTDYIRDGESNLRLPLADARGVARVIGDAMGDSEFRNRIGDSARRLVADKWNFRTTWAEVATVLERLALPGDGALMGHLDAQP